MDFLLRRMRLEVIIAAACLVVACSGNNGTTDAPETSTSPTGSGSVLAYDQVLAQIRSDGDVNLSTALEAFSLAFGELPGVTLPEGGRSPVIYGGGPLRWIERFWDDLTDAQRTTAVSLLGFDPLAGPGDPSQIEGLVAPRPARSESTCQAGGWTDPPGVESYRATFDAAVSKLAGVVGPLSGLTTVRLCQSALPGDEGAWAAVHPQWGGNGYVGCVMYVYSPLANANPAEGLAILTHEAWHCYQASTAANSTEHWSRPDWVIEGEAMWVGEAFGGGPTTNPRAKEYWQEWMRTPEDSLFGRSYDAVGFWSTLAAASSPDDALSAMLRTVGAEGDDEALYGASVSGLGAAAEYLWASRYFRLEVAPSWDTTGPGVQPSSVAPAPHISDVPVGDEITASSYSAKLANLTVPDDLVIVTVDGPTRVGDSAGVDVVVAGSFTGCTRQDQCKCPEGTTAPGPVTAIKSPLRVAVTGVTQDTIAQTEGMSLDEWCQRTTTTSSVPDSEPAAVTICDVFTYEDALLMTPDVSSTPAAAEPQTGSGTCIYADMPSGSSLSSAFILQRPTSALAAGDYPTIAAICTNDLPGIGDRAGTGTGPDGQPTGCLLKGRTIVLLTTNGNAAAIPEVLGRIADRL